MKTLNYNDQLAKLETSFAAFSPLGTEKQALWVKDIVLSKIEGIKNMAASKSNLEIDFAKYALFCCFLRNTMKLKNDCKFWINEKDEPAAALGRFYKNPDMKEYFESAKLKF